MKGKKHGFTVDSILDRGLKSKVVWAVFLRPTRAYQVAKLIYDKVDSRSGKIYQYLRDLEKFGYVQREKLRYSVKTEKIVEEIEKFLLEKRLTLDQEEKEILFHLLESKIFRGYLALMTYQLVHKGNTKNGGFLADLFSRLAIWSMNVIDESRLKEGKPDLKKECRTLNKKINEAELSTDPYTIDVLFRKKTTELEIQYFKEFEEKLVPNIKSVHFDNHYLFFQKNYLHKVWFSFGLLLWPRLLARELIFGVPLKP